MQEGLDFDTALRRRLALLRGMPERDLHRVWDRLRLNAVRKWSRQLPIS
jgi:phosphoserine phosphatase